MLHGYPHILLSFLYFPFQPLWPNIIGIKILRVVDGFTATKIPPCTLRLPTQSRPAASPQENNFHSRNNSTRQIQVVHLTTPFTKGPFFARMESLSFEEKSLYSWAESLDNYRLTDDVGITILTQTLVFRLMQVRAIFGNVRILSLSQKKLKLWFYNVQFSVHLSVCVFHKTIIIKKVVPIC